MRSIWLAAPLVLLVGCGVGGSEINVDITVSGDGVDEAVIDFRDEVTTVELPWSTTVTVRDERGVDTFRVLATNPTESGELTCAADWREASDDGTWRRTDSYQVSCGARVRFEDGGIVRLEPTGRRISFEERDAELAEGAAEVAAEQERQTRVDAARALAAGELETVRVGDWDVKASGVLRDAEDYIEELTANTVRGRGQPIIAEVTATYRGTGTGEPRDLAFTLIGGLTLDRFKTFDVSCGVIPEPAHGVGEVSVDDTVTFNVCWQVDEQEMAQAYVEVDQFGVGVDATPTQLLLPEAEGLRGALGDVQTGEVMVGDGWLIEVTDVRVDDLDKIRELQPDAAEPREGRAHVWIEARVTNVGDFASWPRGSSVDWFIAASDGITRYDDGVGDRCPRYPSPLTDRDIGDPLIEPGDSVVLNHCWHVSAEHVDGATLLISAFDGSALFDLGL